MNSEAFLHLLAERQTLKDLLSRISKDAVLDRATFDGRLRAVESLIAAQPADTRSPARARLTFRGRPVVDSYGIHADFGMEATKSFADTVALAAAGLDRPLKETGPIPNREQSQLLITSTAIGSFGFELEEYRNQPLLADDDSALAAALNQTQQLLEGSAGTDDELTDAAAGVDPRVLAAVKSFLETLAKNDAVCTLEYRNRITRFQDVAQVRRGAKRLSLDNLREDAETFAGEFQGVLPKRRTFEFKTLGGEVILGRFGQEIEDPDRVNKHLHQRTTVTLIAVRAGNGRPRYVLKQEPTWIAPSSGPK